MGPSTHLETHASLPSPTSIAQSGEAPSPTDTPDPDMFQNMLCAGDSPPAFRLKHRIVGPRGRHLHHIQNLTGAHITCAGCPLQLGIRASSQSSLDMALHMSKDLLNKVAEDYIYWCQSRLEGAVAHPALSPRARAGRDGRSLTGPDRSDAAALTVTAVMPL